ncbi:MAG: transcriptional repressor [Deltaproteobacteria bacterium]|nr:transcriptional repressor [Deltaproteobacteria bacterium]
MFSDNQYEKTNFRTLIENDDIGMVEERLNIIDTFLSTEDHVTLEDLMRMLRARGYDYEPDFVRQCMNRWVEQGFAQKERFEGQPPRYEHRHLGKHHDHLICTKCGNILEFNDDEMERLQVKIAAERGFHILQHKMEIYGLCTECLRERSPLMSLAMAKSGERVVIKDILGGITARARLSAMGLRQGDLLEIINNNGQGRLIVGHECTRLALGRGIAQKITVSLAPSGREMICNERK